MNIKRKGRINGEETGKVRKGAVDKEREGRQLKGGKTEERRGDGRKNTPKSLNQIVM